MWKAGLVDPDAPTIQRDISNDRFKKGIVGTKDEFPAYMEGTEKAGKELNPNYKLSYITGVVEKEGGKYTTATSSTGMWGVWCVSSTAEKPARLVEMLDYLISDEYWGNTMFGYEGMTFKVEDGDFKAIDEATATGGIGRNMMRRNDNAVFFSSIKKTPEENKRVLDLINTGIAQYEFPLDGGFRPAIADDPTFIDYEKNMKIQITKIIVGELSVDEWDGILDDWYTAGGETYIKQMQEHIASTKQ